MKTRLALIAASLACLSAAPLPAARVARFTATPVVGDYVEARTASVFAGACHYNGERVTTGHEAVLAWHVTGGTWKDTDLAGVRAAAEVSCDDTLGDEAAPRRTELVVDGTAAQAAAFADLLAARCGKQLGPVVSVRRAAVAFGRTGRAYRVEAGGFADLAVQPMPNNECCSQPSLVWFSPLVPLEHRKVGFAAHSAYTAGTLGDAWEQDGENSAFYGAFSL